MTHFSNIGLKCGDSNPPHCLISMGRARTLGAPSLLLADIQSADVHVLRFPPSLGPVSESSGVAANDRYIFLAVQILDDVKPYFYYESFFLLVLDRTDLSLAGLHPLEGCRDVHSICLQDETLYVVSTGTDEVLSLRLRGPEVVAISVFWRPEPNLPAQDAHHLNSISVWNGDLIVSGFGRRSGALWELRGRWFYIQHLARGASGLGPVPSSFCHAAGRQSGFLRVAPANNSESSVRYNAKAGRVHARRVPCRQPPSCRGEPGTKALQEHRSGGELGQSGRERRPLRDLPGRSGKFRCRGIHRFGPVWR